MREAVIVSMARTPIGRAKKGSLKDTRPEYFAARVLEAVVERTPGLDKGEVDDIHESHVREDHYVELLRHARVREHEIARRVGAGRRKPDPRAPHLEVAGASDGRVVARGTVIYRIVT